MPKQQSSTRQDSLSSSVSSIAESGVFAGGQLARRHCMILLFGTLSLWGAFLYPVIADGRRIGNDGAQYITCARNIVAGQGFLVRNWAASPESSNYRIIQNQPPGYPLLIAVPLKAGIHPVSAAIGVSVLCCALYIVTLGCFFYARFGLWIGGLVLLANVLMPCFLVLSGIALSEAACYLFSLLSLFSLMQWSRAERYPSGWIILAGILGGCALCIRFSSTALFATSAAFIAGHILWRRWREVAVAMFLWFCGWFVSAGWLIGRNLLTFGKINPYVTSPSELSLWENLRWAWFTLAYDFTASRWAADLLNSKFLILTLLVVSTGAIYLSLRRYSLTELSRLAKRFRCEILLLLFVVASFSTVVIARSIYSFDVISSRQFALTYWILWMLLTMIAAGVAKRLIHQEKTVKLILTVVFLVVIGLQLRRLDFRLDFWKEDVTRDRRVACAEYLREIIPKDQVVLTDMSLELSAYGDVNSRRLNGTSNCVEYLSIELVERLASEGKLWGIVCIDQEKCLDGEYGDVIQNLTEQWESYFEKVDGPDADGPLILKWSSATHSNSP